MKYNILKPDLTKAKSKLTITITGYVFDKDTKNGYVETNWNSEGEQLNLGDFLRIIDSGKSQIFNSNMKSDQN